jgi:hypothetical protein
LYDASWPFDVSRSIRTGQRSRQALQTKFLSRLDRAGLYGPNAAADADTGAMVSMSAARVTYSGPESPRETAQLATQLLSLQGRGSATANQRLADEFQPEQFQQLPRPRRLKKSFKL